MGSEFRRHGRRCAAGRPPSGTRLDLFPDHTAFPVWEAGGMSSPGRLGLADELGADLRAWREWWERHSPYGGGEVADAGAWERWDSDGRSLADRLAAATGAQVVYRWQDDRDEDCPECGLRPVSRPA